MSFDRIQSARAGATSRRAVYAAFVAVAVSLCTTNLHAKENNRIEEKVVVQYSDLDLSKDGDAKALYARLQNASNAVCGWYDGRDLRIRRLHQGCYEAALEGAIADVNHSALTELHTSGRRIRVARGAQ